MKRIKNRKEAVRRERMAMIASSVFVLAALVGVGFYMRGNTTQEQDDGYEIDFAQLEGNVSNKYDELEEGLQDKDQLARINADDALDYMPREEALEEGIYMEEAGSGKVEIGREQNKISEAPELLEEQAQTPVLETPLTEGAAGTEAALEQVSELPAYTEASGLYMPVEGEVLMHYNMDHTVYFATLDQYKYNPATIISAKEDAPVYACADGTVIALHYNEEIGNAICVDLGNGYQVTYGQVKDMMYKEGDQVKRGQQIATVAAPTKYYSVEGSNLYFALQKDGEVKNAEALLPLE